MPRSPRPADPDRPPLDAERPAPGASAHADGDSATADGNSAPADGDDETTVDTLLRGRVTLVQPRRGFRSSLDPVLLARFLEPPFGRFLDIGCGTGALSFTLLSADAAATGVGVELQPRLARLAGQGRERNRIAARFEILEGDIRAQAAALAARPFDLVATNPPFRQVERGVSSPHEERALANHEHALSLPEWLDCAARLVRPGGRVAVVYPAERLPDLLAGMRARDLAPVRLRSIHPFADRSAVRILVEAHQGSRRRLTIEPSLTVHSGEGSAFTPEAARILDGQ